MSVLKAIAEDMKNDDEFKDDVKSIKKFLKDYYPHLSKQDVDKILKIIRV